MKLGLFFTLALLSSTSQLIRCQCKYVWYTPRSLSYYVSQSPPRNLTIEPHVRMVSSLMVSWFNPDAAVCFTQAKNGFEIMEPVAYSERDILSLVIHDSIELPIPIRCACPMSADTFQVEIKPGDATVADPKICQNPVRAVLYYEKDLPKQVQTYYTGFEIWEPGVEKMSFLPVVEIAYDMSLLMPIYAKYKYRSPVLNYLVFWSTQNYEPAGDLFSFAPFGDQHLDKLYSLENQQKIFAPFLDDSYYENIFKLDSPILVKQQLAQHLDFLLDTWKTVTFFNANTAPMFVAVRWTWMKIEAFVVKVAKTLRRDLYITTGVSKVKKLINSRMKSVPIYLNTKTTPPTKPVPNIFWKILQYTSVRDDEANKYGLLVIMHNDPLFERRETICTNIETIDEWREWIDDDETDQLSKNIAYICQLNEENLRKLELPVSLPVVENFLNVNELQKRFDINNPDRAPFYRFF